MIKNDRSIERRLGDYQKHIFDEYIVRKTIKHC